MQVRRWIGSERSIIVVADNAFCCRDICKTCIKHNVTFCTQLRLDASLYDFPPIQEGKRRGRPRVVGDRLPNLADLVNDETQQWERLNISWYKKDTITFSDVLVYLRLIIFNNKYFPQSEEKPDYGKIDFKEIVRLLPTA